MADKARTTFPIAVDFVEGELPTAAKMNGLARQTRQGLGIVENMLGDAWNQSGDSVFQSVEDARNMIPNLARALGPSRLLNPRIPYLPDIEEYTHQFTAATGTYEAQLPFPPAAGTTYVWSGGATLDSTPVATKDLVIATNDWWIDTNSGRIVTYDEIQGAWQLTYEPVIDSDLGNDATWNMVPDPDTDASWAFRSVKIEYKNGTDDSEGYTIFLPPRGPLDTRRVAQSPQDDVHVPAHSDNLQGSPSVGTRRFWQDDSVDADIGADAEHYRYLLPKILTDNWGQASTIPTGLMYLYDPAGSGTIIEGLILSAEDAATPRKFVVRATGGNLTAWLSGQGATAYPSANLTALADHSVSMYPSNGLRLITIGTSISAAFSALVEHFLNHDHGTPSSLMNVPVSHDKLADAFDPDGFTPQLVASNLDLDTHSQYLHRGGVQVGRDRYNNAMLGDLLLASTTSGSDYQNESGDSRKILFGSQSGTELYYNTTTGVVHLDAGTNAVGFRINEPGNANFIDFQNAKGSAASYMSVGQRLNVALGSGEMYFTNSSNELRFKNGTQRIASNSLPVFHSSMWADSNDFVIETETDDLVLLAGDTLELHSGAGVNINTATGAAGNVTIAKGGTTSYVGGALRVGEALTFSTTQTAQIVQPLCGPHDEGWIENNEGWICETNGRKIQLQLSDWPNGCLVKKVWVIWWAQGFGAAANYKLYNKQHSISTGGGDWIDTGSSGTIAVPISLNTREEVKIFDGSWGSFNKDTHMLGLELECDFTGDWFGVWSVKMEVTYTQIAPYPA